MLRLLVLLVLTAAAGRAETDTAAAIALFHAGKYPEARAALAAIVARRPADAPACYYLGMAIRHRGDERALDDALPWLERAAALAPANADYRADYGGTCLEVADRRRSFSLATRGRDNMETALRLDPTNLDARFGLMRFYAEAPWPLGDVPKAFAAAEEIHRRNAGRGLGALIWLGRYFSAHGQNADARDACARASRLDPHNAAVQEILETLK